MEPTFTHKSLTELYKIGKLDFIVSQVIKQCSKITKNYDNLHLKSGFPKEKIAELHGVKILTFVSKSIESFC